MQSLARLGFDERVRGSHHVSLQSQKSRRCLTYRHHTTTCPINSRIVTTLLIWRRFGLHCQRQRKRGQQNPRRTLRSRISTGTDAGNWSSTRRSGPGAPATLTSPMQIAVDAYRVFPGKSSVGCVAPIAAIVVDTVAVAPSVNRTVNVNCAPAANNPPLSAPNNVSVVPSATACEMLPFCAFKRGPSRPPDTPRTHS